jgi:hypothetical protein
VQLLKGWHRLDELFGNQLMPVLVPPFNQVSPHLIPTIRTSYRYVSLFSDFSAPRMKAINAHCSTLAWKPEAVAAEVEDLIVPLVTALRLRRYRMLPVASPIGIITHHLNHGTEAWRLLETLLKVIIASGSVQFPPLVKLFNE